MRHRQGKKYTRHGRIEGLDKLLRKMEKRAEVETIAPGKIHNINTRGRGLTIRVQTIDAKRIKCVATRTGRRQELLIVSRNPEATAEWIRAQEWGL